MSTPWSADWHPLFPDAPAKVSRVGDEYEFQDFEDLLYAAFQNYYRVDEKEQEFLADVLQNWKDEKLLMEWDNSLNTRLTAISKT